MEKLHSQLIPIKKAVSDYRTGLILRTYYIRPEKLTKIINELKFQSEIKIKNQNINDIIQIVEKTNDISLLKQYIKHDKYFTTLANHKYEINKIASLEPSIYLHKSINKINSFLLSGDKNYLNNISSLLKKASTKYNINYKVKEKKIKNNEKKSNKNNNEIIKEQDNKQSSLLYDTIIEYTPYLEKQQDPIDVAKKISKLINFYNPSEYKLQQLYSKLYDNDSNYVALNLVLIPNLYYKNIDIINILKKIIISKYKVIYHLTDNDEDRKYIDTSWLTYFYLLLPKNIREDMLSIYHYKPVKILLSSVNLDWYHINNNEQLKLEDKLAYLLTTDLQWIKNNMRQILNTKDNNLLIKYIKYIALRDDVNINDTIKLFEKINHKFFDLNEAVKNIVNVSLNDDTPSYQNILLQTFISKILNIKYLPYDSIIKLDDIMESFLITKTGKYLFQKEKNNIIHWISSNQVNDNTKMTLYLKIPDYYIQYIYQLDPLLPVRLQPLTVLTTQKLSNSDIQITIPLNEIIKYDENIYLTFSNKVLQYVE